MPGVDVPPKGQRSTHFSLADIASAHGVPESVLADRVSALALSNDLFPFVDFQKRAQFVLAFAKSLDNVCFGRGAPQADFRCVCCHLRYCNGCFGKQRS